MIHASASVQRRAALAEERSMVVAEHLVASVRGLAAPLLEPMCADWLWTHLRGAIPDALSNVLMPDHLHLMAPEGYERRFRRVLTGFTQVFGYRFEVLPPVPSHSAAIAQRTIRYGFLNPVRAKLVDDPWKWPASTLRDLAGLAHPVWTEPGRLAKVLRLSPNRLLSALTDTSDGAFAPPSSVPVRAATLSGMQGAVAMTLRVPFNEVARQRDSRSALVQLWCAIGSPSLGEQAQALGVSARSIQRYRTAPLHPAVPAALRCLADPRLLA